MDPSQTPSGVENPLITEEELSRINEDAKSKVAKKEPAAPKAPAARRPRGPKLSIAKASQKAPVSEKTVEKPPDKDDMFERKYAFWKSVVFAKEGIEKNHSPQTPLEAAGPSVSIQSGQGSSSCGNLPPLNSPGSDPNLLGEKPVCTSGALIFNQKAPIDTTFADVQSGMRVLGMEGVNPLCYPEPRQLKWYMQQVSDISKVVGIPNVFIAPSVFNAVFLGRRRASKARSF